jgi:hypothetical protein
MVNVNATAQALSDDYVKLGTFIGLATGDPGSTSTPMHEASGGSPAYARRKTSWTAGSDGVNNGSLVTFDVPAGIYTHMILCSGPTGNNMVDNCPIPQQILNNDGHIALNPVYTQS